jgi:tRNA1Val (adenine37-N6)-methyltransferase
MDDLTADTFFGGLIKVFQSRRGYRFSIDAVLLAAHAHPKSGDTVVDLGTGCGIVPLLMAFRHPGIRILGVEIQPSLAEIARLNVGENDLSGRIRIICRDIRTLSPGAVSGPADLMVTNPPFRKARSGRVNPHPEKARARHEEAITLPEVMKTARRLLRNGGRLVTIYPADRAAEVLVEMDRVSIRPKFLRTVHSKADTEARLCLAAGTKGGRSGGLRVAPPLIIYNDDGTYTDEVQAMFGG